MEQKTMSVVQAFGESEEEKSASARTHAAAGTPHIAAKIKNFVICIALTNPAISPRGERGEEKV